MIRSPGATVAFASRGLRATAWCAAVGGASGFGGGAGALGRRVEGLSEELIQNMKMYYISFLDYFSPAGIDYYFLRLFPRTE